MDTAVGRHLALAGFMGAGKTTVGAEVARLVERPFVDVDAEIEREHGPIARIFEERGEDAFRELEEAATAAALVADEPGVIALGGGALGREATRERLARRAFVVWLDVDVEAAWDRARGGDRPLARDPERFRALFAERRETYLAAADGVARDAEEVLLATMRIDVRRGRIESPPEGRLALVADERVLDLHRPPWPFESVHALPVGEQAKSIHVVERVLEELTLDRGGTLVGLGGGAATDVAGFVAATYLRGIAWVAVPTTLVGMVDAAIGGKTGINLATGKNLAGAFHLPREVVIDPNVLSTLPEAQRREGMAEVVKTGLLAGRELWREDDEAMVRGSAAYKAAVCVSDPTERGRRAILNLGHTFAHALEAGAGYGSVSHGEAVAVGLTAALELSERHLGLDPGVREEVERVLAPAPVRADPDVAWAALGRDKKAANGKVRLVLLEAPGRPVYGVELPDREVREALGRLIAK